MTDNNLFLKFVGLTLKKERLENNLSVKEMADLMGLSEQTIVSIERGTRGTSLENYKKMSVILDFSMDKLVGKNVELMLASPGPKKENKTETLAARCRGLTDEQADKVMEFIDQFVCYTNDDPENDPERLNFSKKFE